MTNIENLQNIFSDIDTAVGFILENLTPCKYCIPSVKCGNGEEDCQKGIKKWLKSEVEK